MESCRSKWECQCSVGGYSECWLGDSLPGLSGSLREANEAWAAESLWKIINILVHAGTSWATEPQETSQWKRLLGFSAINLNMCSQLTSISSWACFWSSWTGVLFSCGPSQPCASGHSCSPLLQELSSLSSAPNYTTLNNLSTDHLATFVAFYGCFFNLFLGYENQK